MDKGVSVMDKGVSIMDKGVSIMDKGVSVMDKGVSVMESFKAYIKWFFVLISVFSFQSFAEEPWKFRSQGYEVNIHYQGNIKQPKAIGFDPRCTSSSCSGTVQLDQMLEDFVYALQNKSIYRYKWVVTCPSEPCDDLQEMPTETLTSYVSDLLLLPDEPVYTSGGSRLTRRVERSREFGQIAYEGAVAATGSSLVTEIVNYFKVKSAESTGNSPSSPVLFQIYTNSNGKPVSMCKITGVECTNIEEVTIANLSNGGVGISTPAEHSGSDAAMRVAMDAFIMQYLTQRQYKCRETFVAIGKRWYRQRVCYYVMP
jgi:hypothetical protein